MSTVSTITGQVEVSGTPNTTSASSSTSISTPIASVLDTGGGEDVPQGTEDINDGKHKENSKEIEEAQDAKSKRRDKRLKAIRWAQSLDEHQMELSTAVDENGVPYGVIVKLGGQEFKHILLDAKIAYARKIGIVVKQTDRSIDRIQELLYVRASGVLGLPKISTKAHKGSKRKHEESLEEEEEGDELEILQVPKSRKKKSALSASRSNSTSSSRNTTSAAAHDESECDDDEDNDGPILSHTAIHAITSQVGRGMNELKLKFQYSRLRELQDLIYESNEQAIEAKAEVQRLFKKFEACKDNDHEGEDEPYESGIPPFSRYSCDKERLRTQIKKCVRKKKYHKAQLAAGRAEYVQLKKRLKYESDEGEDSDDELLSLSL